VRYAVLSDVHGNLEALEVVLEHASRLRPDACLCLGDTVGYGPDPDACVRRMRALGGPAIAGNHDRAAAGALDISAFTPLARAAIAWTGGVISEDTRNWLAGLPERVEGPAFLAVHGSPRDPIEEYIVDLPTSSAIFAEYAFTLCLVGHSHLPGAFVLAADGRVGVHRLPAGRAVPLAASSRYIINVGSVGQPRDGDPRACYLLLDLAARSVTLHRLDYPLVVTQEKMAARGLPASLAHRLALGR
jgi:diadenosine tetraphosphatase ApaH/serine/threonine PP2A family protein phosphatase